MSRKKSMCIKTIQLIITGLALILFGQNCSVQGLNMNGANSQKSVASPEIRVTSSNRLAFGETLKIEVIDPVESGNYIWSKDGQVIFAATGSSFEVATASLEERGSYQVIINSLSSNEIEIVIDHPVSCKQIKTELTGKSLSDGPYEIDPDGTGPVIPLTVNCDMNTDGGGWTEITKEIANIHLSGAVTDVIANATASGVDQENRPFCQDAGNRHYCQYNFSIPFGYDQFFLKDYNARSFSVGNNTSEIRGDYIHVDWAVQGNGGNGDISFGSPLDVGPKTSFSALGTNFEGNADALPFPFPGNLTVFSVDTTSTAFRIGFNENGGEAEGWYAWDSGGIWVR